jgi:hypothetical protein
MRSDAQLVADIHDLKAQLGLVLQALARIAEAGDRSSYTIIEWRGRHNLSEAQYHKLRRQGRGPRTMQTGDIGQRISVEADRDWIAEREREAAEKHQAKEAAE